MNNFNNQFDEDAFDNISRLKSKLEIFASSNVLITGAAGFLGSHFCHFFHNLNQGFEDQLSINIFAIDNFKRGKPIWIKRFENFQNFQVINSDIVEMKDFPEADFIIHAASIASPIFYRKYPIETMDANVIGLRNLLNHAKQNPCKSLLYFSTSEIYGDPDSSNIPPKESYRGNVSCVGPRACYDESKRYGETLCINFFNQFEIPIKIVRPFNNYGPGLSINDGRVISDFFRDALNNKNIQLFSNGKATRTFCYVSDAIYGYLLALMSNFNGEVFNIGNPHPEISIEDLATKIIKITNKNLSIIKSVNEDKNYLTDNPQRRCPDISKATKFLNFKPKISLDEGLKKTLKYYIDIVRMKQ